MCGEAVVKRNLNQIIFCWITYKWADLVNMTSHPLPSSMLLDQGYDELGLLITPNHTLDRDSSICPQVQDGYCCPKNDNSINHFSKCLRIIICLHSSDKALDKVAWVIMMGAKDEVRWHWYWMSLSRKEVRVDRWETTALFSFQTNSQFCSWPNHEFSLTLKRKVVIFTQAITLLFLCLYLKKF